MSKLTSFNLYTVHIFQDLFYSANFLVFNNTFYSLFISHHFRTNYTGTVSVSTNILYSSAASEISI